MNPALLAIDGHSLTLEDVARVARGADVTVALAPRGRERLEAHGAKPSVLKEAVMAVGGKGFVLFARSQTDTPGKLAAHALSYEALEIGSYELLRRVAERAGDSETVQLAGQILAEERAAAEKLRALFAQALDGSLRELSLPSR